MTEAEQEKYTASHYDAHSKKDQEEVNLDSNPKKLGANDGQLDIDYVYDPKPTENNYNPKKSNDLNSNINKDKCYYYSEKKIGNTLKNNFKKSSERDVKKSDDSNGSADNTYSKKVSKFFDYQEDQKNTDTGKYCNKPGYDKKEKSYRNDNYDRPQNESYQKNKEYESKKPYNKSKAPEGSVPQKDSYVYGNKLSKNYTDYNKPNPNQTKPYPKNEKRSSEIYYQKKSNPKDSDQKYEGFIQHKPSGYANDQAQPNTDNVPFQDVKIPETGSLPIQYEKNNFDEELYYSWLVDTKKNSHYNYENNPCGTNDVINYSQGSQDYYNNTKKNFGGYYHQPMDSSQELNREDQNYGYYNNTVDHYNNCYQNSYNDGYNYHQGYPGHDVQNYSYEPQVSCPQTSHQRLQQSDYEASNLTQGILTNFLLKIVEQQHDYYMPLDSYYQNKDAISYNESSYSDYQQGTKPTLNVINTENIVQDLQEHQTLNSKEQNSTFSLGSFHNSNLLHVKKSFNESISEVSIFSSVD